MALLFIEGFGGIAAADLPLVGYVATGSPAGSIVSGRYATSKALQLTPTIGNYYTLTLPAFSGSLLLGVANFVSALSGNGNRQSFFSLRDSVGALVCGFGSDATGVPFITFNGSTYTTGASAVLLASQFQYLELQYVSGGTTVLRVNGVAVVTTTAPAGTPTTLRIGDGTNNALGVTQKIADLYIADTSGTVNNALLGDSQVVNRFPRADVAGQQWAPSTGTAHYSLVNDTAEDGDSTYIESSTPGQVDRFTSSDAIGTPVAVYGVGVRAIARKTDGATRQINLQIANGASVASGPTATLGTSFAGTAAAFNTDPATGAAWTLTGASNAQFGVNVVA